MKIVSINHYSVLVSDLDKAIFFYTEILGFSQIERPERAYNGAWIGLPEGKQLHLLALLDNPRLIENPYGGRDAHIAFNVENLEQAVARFKQYNIEYMLSKSGRKALFCRDYDGNAIELQEV